MKTFIQHASIKLSLFFLLLASCSKQTAFTDFSNPYDELSTSFIPAPNLNTAEVHGILALEAWSGGEFSNDYSKPVTAKDVCWSIEQNPTIADNCTNDGGDMGAFQSHLTELEPDQKYYVRAYATNADMTIYGGQREFTTETTDDNESLIYRIETVANIPTGLIWAGITPSTVNDNIYVIGGNAGTEPYSN